MSKYAYSARMKTRDGHMQGCLVLRISISLLTFDIWLHCLLARLPSSWANLSVLKSLDQSQGFIDISSNWQIIDGDLSDGTSGLNDEKYTNCNTLILLEDSKRVFGNVCVIWKILGGQQQAKFLCLFFKPCDWSMQNSLVISLGSHWS
jgi:hypothetical protein